MATTSELLKDLPSRNSTNFSQYNHCSFKSDSKRYVRLKTHEDGHAAQVIQMDETSMLNRELTKLQKKNSVKKPIKPIKRSNDSSSNGHSSSKYRRKDLEDDEMNDEREDSDE